MLPAVIRSHTLFAIALFLALSLGACSGFVASFTGEDVAQEIRAVGLPAEATVLRIWETGVKVNDNPVVGFLLEVHAPDLEPWEAETKALISILDIPQIQPGASLQVVYDPDDPSRVAIGRPDA